MGVTESIVLILVMLAFATTLVNDTAPLAAILTRLTSVLALLLLPSVMNLLWPSL